MSMLAEQKRKKKFGPDPRNTFWSSDETKFGFRMLESMGWKKGKGLGAKESGMTEHLTAKHRKNDDVTGLGCSKKHAENWIAHQDDFNSILASLNKSSDKADVGSKLPESASASHAMEEKSKSSRSRVHYHKVIRSKDLSSRSSDDLNCIFGRRKGRSSENLPPTPQSEANGNESNSSDDQSSSNNSNSNNNNNNNVAIDVHSHGVKTITSSSSVQEYFAMKMAELKQKREAGAVNTSCNNGDENADSSTESNNKTLESADDPLNDSQCVSGVADVGASEDSEHVEKQKRKKKKKKNRREDQENHVECENLSADEVLAPGDSCADGSPESNSACTEQQSSKSKKKKEKRKKKAGSSECGVDSSSQLSSAEEPENEPKAKKAKKQSEKLGLLASEQEETFEILHQNGIGEEGTEEPKKKKKKKQKKKEKDTEVESHNSSILRQKSDGKTSRRKSVRFSTGDVEIFLIPNKEDEKAEQGKEEALSKKSLKKRKKRKANSAEETETRLSKEGEASSPTAESVQGEKDDPQTLKEDDNIPKRKKRKREKEASSSTGESAQGETDDQQALKDDYVPKKKKRKTEKEASSSTSESAEGEIDDPQTLKKDNNVPKKKKRKTKKEASSSTSESAQGEIDDQQALKDDDVPKKKKGKTEEGGKEARKKKSKAEKENLETHQGPSAEDEPSHLVPAGTSDDSVQTAMHQESEHPVGVRAPWMKRAKPKKEITQELVDRICDSFVGSNLRDIKGYTYYASLYANQHQESP